MFGIGKVVTVPGLNLGYPLNCKNVLLIWMVLYSKFYSQVHCMGKVFLTTSSQLCLVTSCCNQRVATTLQYIVFLA